MFSSCPDKFVEPQRTIILKSIVSAERTVQRQRRGERVTYRLLQRVTYLGDVRRFAPKHERLLGRIVVHLQRAEAVRPGYVRGFRTLRDFKKRLEVFNYF